VLFVSLQRRRPPSAQTRTPELPSRGAQQVEIDALGEHEFETDEMSMTDARCAICLVEYSAHEKLRTLRCSHHFHKECIDLWLKNNKNCPLCQQNISTATDVRGNAISSINEAGESSLKNEDLNSMEAGHLHRNSSLSHQIEMSEIVVNEVPRSEQQDEQTDRLISQSRRIV
jgi:hypothetical protein